MTAPRVGVIARCDDRGLGHLTWQVAVHMADEVLVVDAGQWSPFPQHPGRYPGAEVTPWDARQQLDESTVRRFLRTVDVVYTAETWYDDRLPQWCADEHVALVCHVMPELLRADWAATPAVVWWAPTSWRLAALPHGTRLVPVPVPDRRSVPAARATDRVRFLHVGGRRAAGDRNGTLLVASAVRWVTAPCTVTMRSQDGVLPRMTPAPGVDVERVTDDAQVAWWEMYGHDHVLVLPRRYGGLCLPVLEAMAAGMAVLMPDVEPQRSDWPPVLTVPVAHRRELRTPCGPVDVHDVAAVDLAYAMAELARDPAAVARAQDATTRWADAHGWDQLGALWREEMAEAARAR